MIMHVYKFTHYNANLHSDTIQTSAGIKDIILGIDIPRPENDTKPRNNYEEITLESNNKKIEGWYISTDSLPTKGTVFMGHGYNASKTSMLKKTSIFLESGYDVLLIDFMGCGGSEGNQTTIGYYESDNVQSAYEYLVNKGDSNIILFGTSMGAASIMKALYDNTQIKPKAVILECPYGTMLETIKARFRIMNLPDFIAYPFAFWGGTINNFNAFSLNPEEYAKDIKCPTLLIYGKKDDRVSLDETINIFDNLGGIKGLKIYPNSGHDNYLENDKEDWSKDIQDFIANLK